MSTVVIQRNLEDDNYVWDPNTMMWVKMQQPILNAGTVVIGGPIDQGTGGSSPWLIKIDQTGTNNDVDVASIAAGSNLIGKVNILGADLSPSSPTSATVGTGSTQVVAANASRKGLVLINTSVNYISLGFGAPAVLYSGITLNPQGGTFEMDDFMFDLGAVNAIASDTNSNLSIQEYI